MQGTARGDWRTIHPWRRTVQAALGILAFMFLAWLVSENRRVIDFRVIAAGLGLQFLLAALLLKITMFRDLLLQLNSVVLMIEKATRAGTTFVFGYLGGGVLPFDVTGPPGSAYALAFRGLPIILFMSALSALLFHWRILPAIVRGFSFVLRRSLGLGGALGVGVAANIFIGMIEAPLMVRPYVQAMTHSELFALMVSGMATIAGTMIVLYASILGPIIPGSLGHLIVASIISAPASVLMARLMVPETRDATQGDIELPKAAGSMDAIARGALDGLQLLLHVVALLIVLIALVSLVNQLLDWLPAVGDAPLTLQRITGWLLAPVAWLMGLPWKECHTAGSLLGTKVILNEFVAYMNMAGLDPAALSERSRIIMTYAMCGFANLGSLGIMIGGMGSLAPERRSEIVALGFRSIYAGMLATAMTGAIVGILL
ncbi:nucleoside:proton symporter [Oceanidesulfovibrio marinus]|uniref:Nucleoside:proton symporter n=1 Tax=Oceanidesulfovibrio marinus TaxID=370038 RepID=A0ABX6NKB9_9BACT|nr:nucleoside:proton symporter [Oceanidesulfovibrio marinus]